MTYSKFTFTIELANVSELIVNSKFLVWFTVVGTLFNSNQITWSVTEVRLLPY